MDDLKKLPGQTIQDITARGTCPDYVTSHSQTARRWEAESTDDDENDGFREYFQVLWRRKGFLVIFSFLGAMIGLMVSLPQTPTYQVRTSLEIQEINDNFFNTREIDPFGDSSRQASTETQIRILQSRSLIERVVGKLKLQNGHAPSPPPDRLSTWRMTMDTGLRRLLGLPQPTPVPQYEQALATAAANFRVRGVGQARILEIFCDSTDPKLAADFVNTLAQEFIEYTLEARWKSTQRTGEWLSRQLRDLKTNLQKSEEQLQTYARASGLMFTAENDSVAEQKLGQLQQELSAAHADRIAKQARYETVRSSPPESLPDVVDDNTLREYQSKITELQRQQAELNTSLTPVHYKILRVQAQIGELQAALEKARANIIGRISNDYEAARRREGLIAADHGVQAKLLSEQGAKLSHYNILKREVDTNRQLYEAILQRVKEFGVTSALRASNIHVIDPAIPPHFPYKPKPLQDAGLGLLAGAFLGVVFIVARDRVDRSIRTPGDVLAHVGLPELGVIPSAKVDPEYRRKTRLLARIGSRRDKQTSARYSILSQKSYRGNGRRTGALELVTWERKPSLLAESFRATLASVLFYPESSSSPRVIVLTSPLPKEGKTTVTANLGIALAEINRRVLLLDGDIRKPSLHKVFNTSNKWGLSELLRDVAPVDGYAVEALATRTEIPGLYVLPCGSNSASISNLLYSPRIYHLLSRLRKEFDAILIDAAPMMHVSDTRVLGRMADGVILVVRCGTTTQDSARAALQRLSDDGIAVLGAILNDWDPKKGPGNGYFDQYYKYYRR